MLSAQNKFCTYVKIHKSKTLIRRAYFCIYVKIHRSKTSNMYFSMKLTQIFIKFYFYWEIIVYWLKTAATIQLISLSEYIYNRFVDFQLESAIQMCYSNTENKFLKPINFSFLKIIVIWSPNFLTTIFYVYHI